MPSDTIGNDSSSGELAALPPVFSQMGPRYSPDTGRSEPVAPFFTIRPVDQLLAEPEEPEEPEVARVPEVPDALPPIVPTGAEVRVAGLELKITGGVTGAGGATMAMGGGVTESSTSEEEVTEEFEVPDEVAPTPEAEVSDRAGVEVGQELLSFSPASAAAHDLAERLESIARRLRTDGSSAVVAGMRGDRFDALLAGLFAGYLAAREGDG